MNKRIFITLSVAFAAFACLATRASAAVAPCAIGGNKFDKLKTIANDPALDSGTKIREALALRKELLTQTLDCAISDAQALQTNLSGVSIPDPDIARIQTRILGRISEAISYYQTQEASVNDLGLQGSHDFAANLKTWRAGNYTPLIEAAQNLILWSHNQDLIQTAQNRMNQISHTMVLLSIVNDKDVQTPWQNAEANFNDAQNFNQQATDSLKAIDDPDTSLDLIKSSLGALSKVYQNFLDLSDALSNVLPTTPQ